MNYSIFFPLLAWSVLSVCYGPHDDPLLPICPTCSKAATHFESPLSWDWEGGGDTQSKSEDLSSNPKHPCKMLGTVTQEMSGGTSLDKETDCQVCGVWMQERLTANGFTFSIWGIEDGHAGLETTVLLVSS